MVELEASFKLPHVHKSPHSSTQGPPAVAKGIWLVDAMVVLKGLRVNQRGEAPKQMDRQTTPVGIPRSNHSMQTLDTRNNKSNSCTHSSLLASNYLAVTT